MPPLNPEFQNVKVLRGSWLAGTQIDRERRIALAAALVRGAVILDHLTPRQAAAITGVAERDVLAAANAPEARSS